MKPIRVRILEIINEGVSGWTAKEMAAHLNCSYSMARFHMKKLSDASQIVRVFTYHTPQPGRGVRGEWMYFRALEGVEGVA